MIRKQLALLGFLMSCSFFANAAAISTSIGDYEISTIEGSFTDNSALLQSQVWWGDLSLANEFAGLIGDSLGYPHFSETWSPLFAYEETVNSSGDIDGIRFRLYLKDSGVVGSLHSQWIENLQGDPILWAVASPAEVPLPTTVWLFGSALIGLAGIKRRKQTPG